MDIGNAGRAAARAIAGTTVRGGRRFVDVLVQGPGFWLFPLLLTGAVTAYRMDRPAFWRDEMSTWWAASVPFADFVRLEKRVDAVHGCYYLFMRGWIGLFGDSATAMRLPSVLSMAGVAVLVALLARRCYDPFTGLVAGVLFAAVPGVTRFGQEARGYAMVTLVVTLAGFLLLRALDRPVPHRFVWYAAALALAGALHLLAIVVVAGHALAVLATPSRRARASWVLAVALAGLLLLPIVALGRRQRAQVSWLPEITVQYLRDTPDLVFRSAAVGIPVCVLAVLAVRFDRAGALLAGWAFVAPGVLVLVSVVVSPLYEPRYIVFALPAVVVLAAATIRGVTRQRLRYATFNAVTVLGIVVVYAEPAHEQNRQVTQRQGFDYAALAEPMVTGYRPGDGVAYLRWDWVWMVKQGVEYHLPPHVRPAEVFAVRPAQAAGWWIPDECTAPAACRTTAPARIWLIRMGVQTDPLSAMPDGPATVLREDYTVERTWHPQGQTVVLFVRR